MAEVTQALARAVAMRVAQAEGYEWASLIDPVKSGMTHSASKFLGAYFDLRESTSPARLPDYWGVTVIANGETVLTIESDCLSGVTNIDAHAELIRHAGRHLLAFIGE